MIYDLYEWEKSLLAVAHHLNDKGFKSRRGYAWNPTTVQIILRSPFYIGTYRYNYRDEAKTGGNSGNEYKPESEWIMVEDHHEPLVELEQWERVAEILTSNKRIDGNGTSYNRGNVHIFAGLLK